MRNGKKEILHLNKFTEKQIELLRNSFNELDKDGSGQIGVAELMEFQENIGQNCTRQEIIDGYFQDDDGDLLLTFEEFVARLALRENMDSDEVVEAFLFFTEGRKYMDVVKLKSVLMNTGDYRFTEEEFKELISLTGHLPSDKFEVEPYVKDWRLKLAADQ
mgnify:FL=1